MSAAAGRNRITYLFSKARAAHLFVVLRDDRGGEAFLTAELATR